MLLHFGFKNLCGYSPENFVKLDLTASSELSNYSTFNLEGECLNNFALIYGNKSKFFIRALNWAVETVQIGEWKQNISLGRQETDTSKLVEISFVFLLNGRKFCYGVDLHPFPGYIELEYLVEYVGNEIEVFYEYSSYKPQYNKFKNGVEKFLPEIDKLRKSKYSDDQDHLLILSLLAQKAGGIFKEVQDWFNSVETNVRWSKESLNIIKNSDKKVFIGEEVTLNSPETLGYQGSKMFEELFSALNGKQVQYIFSPCDSSAMDSKLLNRSSIWFTSDNGVIDEEIYPLSIFSDRYDDRLSWAFEDGRFC